MSWPHVAQRPSLPSANLFRMIRPKSSYLSPKIFSKLTAFELTLAESLRSLKPKNSSDVLSLSWLRRAMKLLSETHTNIKTLTTALNFPGPDWDEKWTDMYMDDSIKLLDICNGLTSGLARLDQTQLLLRCVLGSIESSASLDRLHDWMEKTHSPPSKKLEKCCSIVKELASTLRVVKVKSSAKGKVLMRALYGVKIVTVFVCSVFAAVLSGCSERPVGLDVSGEFLWGEAFKDLQGSVNGVFSGGEFGVLREVEVVSGLVEKVCDSGMGGESCLELAKCGESFGTELDLLSREIEGFFRLVLAGRDAFLGSLKGGLRCTV